MPETDKPLAFFHDEPIRDTDLTFSEAVTEARRCLNCRVPQCRKGCPIENEIPQFIHELTTGNLGAAAAHIYHRSDLPALCGRICPREAQCEGACILNKKGQPVQIGKLERFVADAAMDAGLLPQKASKKSNGRIAVIGSGPAGLAAARTLAQKDYDVTVFEAASQPGGTMTYGIPTFRLHKELILREVAALERLGVSFQYRQPVQALLGPKMLVTLCLSLVSFVLIVVVSLPLGLLSANGKLDGLHTFLNQFCMAVPPFFTGILISWCFGIFLRVFVPGDFPGLDRNLGRSLVYLFFAAVSIAIPRVAMTVRMLRSTVISEMNKPYVRTAIARGNDRRQVLWGHVLKNSLVQTVTFLGQTMAEIVAGSIVVEQVFSVPGLGRMLVASISNQDYPVVEAIVVILAFWVVLSGTLADLINRYIDPRMGGAAE